MPKEIDDWLVEHAEEYQTRTECVKACIKHFNCHHSTPYRRTSALGLSWPGDEVGAQPPARGPARAPAKLRAKSTIGRDTEVLPAVDFLNSIDRVKQVRDYLDDAIGDDYIEDEKLRRRFSISKERWRELSALPCFADRVFSFSDGETQRRITVWSSKVGIAQAKKTISLDRYATKQ